MCTTKLRHCAPTATLIATMSVWLWILFLVVAAAVYAWATGVTLFKVRDGVAPQQTSRALSCGQCCVGIWLQVAYFLYTRTFLGQVIHNRTLKKYRGQPAHTVSTHVDCGKLYALMRNHKPKRQRGAEPR